MEYGGVQEDESATWKAEGQHVFTLSDETVNQGIVFQCEVLFVERDTALFYMMCFPVCYSLSTDK